MKKARGAKQSSSTKVLIVEDDADIQQLYHQIFVLRKFKVVVAGDGVEALAKVETEKPDVVLLDIMMPRMNGMEVLSELKRDPNTKEIPVIMLSNIADERDIEAALNAGALKYIIKSEYIPRQVVEQVQLVLSKS